MRNYNIERPEESKALPSSEPFVHAAKT